MRLVDPVVQNFFAAFPQVLSPGLLAVVPDRPP